jgi:hypothetical protein
MGVGIQVFQENGEVTLDLKRRLSKVVDVTVLSGTGEITFDQFPGMLPWFFTLIPPIYSDNDAPKETPSTEFPHPVIRIDKSARKIIWHDIPKNGAKIIYGVY